jgi:hypothetical protein
MVKPKFLLQRAATKVDGMEVVMRLPVQTLQGETLNLVRSADRTLLEKGYLEDQS